MPLSSANPGNTVAALAYLRGLENLDRARVIQDLARVVEPIIGEPLQMYAYADVAYPVTWAWAEGTQGLYVMLSGVRTAGTAARLVRSWTDSERVASRIIFAASVIGWGDAIINRILFFNPRLPDSIYIAGHSLGGAIATYMASAWLERFPLAQQYVCTFGQPKVVGPAYNFPARTQMTRWSNPTDNVPSLPPTSDRAPLVYSTLTRAQREIAQSWRQPCQATVINPEGAISVGSDPPSIQIGAGTLLSVLQGSIEGVFGTGHLLGTYSQYLQRAVDARNSEPVSTATVNNNAAVAAPPSASVLTPRTAPAMLTVPELNRQVAVAREAAVVRDQVPVAISSKYRMKAIRVGKEWYVQWMGKEICWGPTRKKAQALARHFNRFLRIYQPVGQSYSNVFVAAMTQYLTIAADPQGPLKPTLYDGGTTPASVNTVVDFDIFGIEFAPLVVP